MPIEKAERLINLTMALLAAQRYIKKSQIFAIVAGYSGNAEAMERMFERDKDDLRNLGIVIEVGGLDPLFDDEPRRIEHWNIPTETGKRVGAVLSAYLSQADNFAELAAQPFTPLPTFWSDQYDMKIQGFGMPGLADRYELVDGELAGELVMAYFRNDALIGVVGIGMTAEVMKYRKQLLGT